MHELTKRQEEIIYKATQIIDKKGIQGLTIKNLSSEIGVTEGAIYRHFKNKREILDYILEQFLQNIKQFRNEKYVEKLSVFEAFNSVFHHFRKVFEKNPAVVSVIFAEEIFQNDSQLSKKVSEIIRNNEQIMFEIINNGKERGEIRTTLNDQMMVNSLLGTFRFMVKKWKINSFKGSLKKDVDNLLEYLKATVFTE